MSYDINDKSDDLPFTTKREKGCFLFLIFLILLVIGIIMWYNL